MRPNALSELRAIMRGERAQLGGTDGTPGTLTIVPAQKCPSFHVFRPEQGIVRNEHFEPGTRAGTWLPYGDTIATLEARCPDLVPVDRWQAAVGDGRAFLAKWGGQAEALGWTARDLFGLHEPPEKPHPSYSRLSRYDEAGLIWLLCGREVVALTEATAAIQSSTGAISAITTYRRHNKPALGPVGDSLDDLQ